MLRVFTARLLLFAIVAAGAAGGAACDDDTPTAPTAPPATVTETFTGSVGPNGAQTHSFATATGGTVTATLKEIAPDAGLVVGFSLGNWNATTSTCQLVLVNDAATGGFIHTGTMSGTGTLCVRVYDVGNIASSSSATYTVEVVHP